LWEAFILKVMTIFENKVEILLSGVINAKELDQFGKHIGSIARNQSEIRLLIDAHQCEGLENTTAVNTHIELIKKYHEKIERVALIPGPLWQHWLARFANLFMKTEIKTFSIDRYKEAQQWLQSD
jgi:hypothetical protein